MDWCPTGFKIGINSKPPSNFPEDSQAHISKSCCLISNSISVRDIFYEMNRKFDQLFAKRAFLYWYVSEGLAEDEIIQCRNNISDLEFYYEEPAYCYCGSSDEEI